MYDAAFKYLMDDQAAAACWSGAVLGEEVESLQVLSYIVRAYELTAHGAGDGGARAAKPQRWGGADVNRRGSMGAGGRGPG